MTSQPLFIDPGEQQLLVQGHGVSNPSVIFIIDHPHGDDFKSGYALTGASERSLRAIMRDCNLYLDQYYRTSLIKTLNPKRITTINQVESVQKVNKQYWDANIEAIAESRTILIDEIETLKPNLLVPLGELSFQFLTGLSGIRKFRGSVLLTSENLLSKRLKVLPILGPYPYLNQDHKMYMISRLDLNRVPYYANDSLPPESQIRVWYAKSAAEFRNFLDRMRSYLNSIPSEDQLLTFDIETFLQIPTCISFCFNGTESCCIPLLDKSIDRDNRAIMWGLVGQVLSSAIPKGNQNIKYDLSKLERWYFKINNVTEDSNLAAGIIYPEFPKNLGFLTSIYTELPYFKDEGKEFDPSSDRRSQLYLYNAKDSLAAWQIIKKQNAEMDELGVKLIYKKLIALLPIYKRMEQNGIRIDLARREELLAKYVTLFNIEVLKLRALSGNSQLNPLSAPQMNKLIFEDFRYQLGRYVKGTDEDSLEWLIQSADHQSYISRDVLKLVINCRKLHKVIEILELPLHPDGFFRAEFNLSGAETGRTTSGKCTDQLIVEEETGKYKVKNLGHSLQTIGKHGFVIDGTTYGQDIRSMFIPRNGYVFVEIDLSGAEARVDRVLSGNYDMNIFTDPGIHRYTGSLLYDCPPTEIKKNTLVEVAPGHFADRYHLSKTVRHAAERNVGPDKLVNLIMRPRAECVHLLSKLHAAEPSIKEHYHRSIIEALNNYPTLVMPNGRRRDFFSQLGPTTYNEAFSTPPQAIVSDQTKFEGILPTFTDLSLPVNLLTEAHDGILVETKPEHVEEFVALYKKNVEKPIDFRSGTLFHDYELTIPCEASMGTSWYDLKELT